MGISDGQAHIGDYEHVGHRVLEAQRHEGTDGQEHADVLGDAVGGCDPDPDGCTGE